MTRHVYSIDTFNRKYIPWLVLLIFCVIYLAVDLSLLHADGSGGYIPGIKKDYRTGKAIFLFYPLPDYPNSETRIEVANDWGSTGWWPYEMYAFSPAHASPLWAPIRIYPPELLTGRDMLDIERINLTPDNSVIQSALTAAAKLDQPERDYVMNALTAYQHPNRLYLPGVARNTFALCVALLLLISVMRLFWLGANDIKFTKQLKSGHCKCGYSLVGLTSPTCPECGRPIETTPTQHSATLDQ